MQTSAIDITTDRIGEMRPESARAGISMPCSWLMLANRPMFNNRISAPRPRPPSTPPTAAALGCLVMPPMTASIGKPTAILNDAYSKAPTNQLPVTVSLFSRAAASRASTEAL
ncbi:hypothetical protein D3C72_2143410 [compost metagenome]